MIEQTHGLFSNTQIFPMRLRKAFCGMILCFGLFDVHADETCGTPQILSPAQTDIGNAKPRFEWTKIPHAKRYRLWLESRLPEGRLLFTHDIQTTSTNWMPPAALTETRALIKMKLFAICEEGGDDTVVTPISPPFMRYRIDVSGSCVLSASPVIKFIDQHVEVTWPSVEGANYYELMTYSGNEAKLAGKNETRDTKFQLQSLTPGLWIISVRPRCSSGYGLYRSKVLNL